MLTYIILQKVENFPDFYNYDNYIISGNAMLRFAHEPLSALLMVHMPSAKQYYIVTWYISSFFLFLIPLFFGKKYLIYSIFLLINPFSIILFQTPRQFIAYSIFCFLILLNSRYKYLLLILPFLFHFISGFFSLFLILLLNIRKSIIPFILIIGLFCLHFFSTHFYSYYISTDIQRGLGRLLLFFFFMFITIFISFKKKTSDKLFLISVLLFILISYLITPYSGRIIPFFIPIIVLYLLKSFNKKDSMVIIHFMLISMIVLSFIIILSGRFGYG